MASILSAVPGRPPPRRTSVGRSVDLGAGDEPVAEEDLLALRLTHRLLRRETRALAALVDGLASGREHVDARRAGAFGDRLESVCDEIAAHRAGEDDVVLPLVRRRVPDLEAGPAGRGVPQALLNEVRRGGRSVVAALLVRPAAVATVADFSRMRELATRFADLAGHVDAHLAGSERVLVGAVLAHVPRAAWIALEDDVRRPWPPWPRLLRVATPAEAASWRARHGWACVTAVRLQATILRRGDRRVYGAGAVLD